MIAPRASGRCSSPAWRSRRRLPAAAALAVLAVAEEQGGLFEYPPTWIPRGGSLANYGFVLTRPQVPWYLWNSLVVARSRRRRRSPRGACRYVLSRDRFRGRRPLLAALLVVQMVSPVILLVPIYGIIERLGLIDTRAGLISSTPRCRCRSRCGCSRTSSTPCRRRSSKRRASTARPARARSGRSSCRSSPPASARRRSSTWRPTGRVLLALVLLDSQVTYTMPLGLFSFQSGYDTDWHSRGGELHRARARCSRVLCLLAALLRRRPDRRLPSTA
jgi:hypothetical protein